MKTPQTPAPWSMHGADLPLEFRLNVHADSAAFDGDDRNRETARILRDVADRLDSGEPFEMFVSLFDINGNRVGSAAFKPEVTE